MHAGFATLRGACPMTVHRRERPQRDPPEGLAADLDRLAALWHWAPGETGGPWLGGAAVLAVDAFHAPVASRPESYARLTPASEPYARRIRDHPAMRRWRAEALVTPRRLTLCDRD